ncbi:hypothetical protein AJ88_32710 [Mesorhizobium amorphae CCBAU 01583]|nr:hypothetical protein AJ88_32710 [Mesorhizobium amorphae CCBAU 01583]
MEQVHLFRVVEAATDLVEQQRIRIPALPQALHDADELFRTAAKIVVGNAFRPAEIGRLARTLVHGRVPAHSAMADDVEGSKTARQIVRLMDKR